MTAVNDRIQLRLFCTDITSPVESVNVFWYRLVDFGTLPVGSDVSRELSTVFNTQIASALNDIVTTATILDRTSVVNYGDPLDFDECKSQCGYPSSGARPGDGLPFVNCWSFRYLRPGPGFRNGYKRFSGLSELDVNSVGNATPVAIVELDQLAAALGAQLVSPAGVIFQPVVARGAKVLGTNPDFYDVTTVFYAGIGTQASRKKPLQA